MSNPLTQADLDQLEKFADKLFNKIGIDVNFTRHFLDRVNDERNRKQITSAELTRLFKQEYRRWGKPIAGLGADAQAIMKDMQTNINVPFVLKYDRRNNELDLIAKTVMRKPNFKSNAGEPIFPIESIVRESSEGPISADSVKEDQVYRLSGRSYPLFQIIKKREDGMVIYIKYTAANESQPKKMPLENFVSIDGIELFGTLHEDVTNYYGDDYGKGIGYDYNNDTPKTTTRRRLYPGTDGQTLRIVKRLEAVKKLLDTNKLLQSVKPAHMKQIKDAMARTVKSIYALDRRANAEQVEMAESQISVIESTVYKLMDNVLSENISRTRVDEITVDHYIGKDTPSSHDFDEYIDSAKPFVGKSGKPTVIKGYEIYISSDPRVIVLMVKNPRGDDFLGGVYLVKNNQSKQIHSEVSFDESIQGKGIAVELYKLAIIDLGITLTSDKTQTKGSMSIWKRLALDPEINVYRWNPYAEDGNFYSSWDPDEDDDDQVYLDRGERRREAWEADRRLEEFTDEIQDKIDNGTISQARGDKLIAQAHEWFDKHDKTLAGKDGTMFMRLVATKA